jgi:exopolysaccharide/PEP-CTERM locus tyrosine autokinase
MSLIEDALRKGKVARTEGKVGANGTTAAPPLARAPTRPESGMRVFGDVARRRRVDREALRRAGLLPPVSEEQEIAHQFRSIKRPLIRSAFESAPADAQDERARRSIMVTSALPGDGKTFTSLNLALSMAMERDHSVILVDGDVLKPHISQLFQATDEPGLLNVLDGSAPDIASAILPTDVPGLSVLPVGRQAMNATELLASARMLGVIRDLEALDPHGIIVVDSSPILLTSEARVLAGLFAQVVMVVRAGGTPQQAVLDAVRLMGDGPQVNLVLNQALHLGGSDYYGYGSGYGYHGKQQEDAP